MDETGIGRTLRVAYDGIQHKTGQWYGSSQHILHGTPCRSTINGIGRIHLFAAQTCTVEQIQVFDALRMTRGKVCDNPASQRIAGEYYTRIAKRIQKAFQVQDMRENVDSLRCHGRSAESGHVSRVDK